MLEELKLENFRCFESHTIKFEKFNVLVGKNNCGKSTIIDALKLIANAIRFSPHRDVYLKESDVPFSVANIRHNYKEEDSRVSAKFSDGIEVEVTFPVEGAPITNISKNAYINDRLFKGKIIGIIPPVSAFEEVEELGNAKYVRKIMVSHLAPRHFRNIWLYFREGFEEFKELVEKTWPGYTVYAPELDTTINRISMFYREYDSQHEIFWAGHGFQIWLQLMTFLVKLGQRETLVLDEPDIYLHSDMQKN
jgi:predicted ATP-dependent endonuclease of OLD family